MSYGLNKLGEEIVCEHCGNTFKRTSGNQRFCKDCAGIHRLKKATEYYYSHKPVPPKPPMIALNRMAAEARRLGLTYGKYVALLNSGGLDDYVKHMKGSK